MFTFFDKPKFFSDKITKAPALPDWEETDNEGLAVGVGDGEGGGGEVPPVTVNSAVALLFSVLAYTPSCTETWYLLPAEADCGTLNSRGPNPPFESEKAETPVLLPSKYIESLNEGPKLVPVTFTRVPAAPDVGERAIEAG